MSDKLDTRKLMMETGAERMPDLEVFPGKKGGCLHFLKDQYIKPENKEVVTDAVEASISKPEEERPNILASDFLRPKNAPYVDPDKITSKGYQLELLRLLKEQMKEGEPFLHTVVSAKLKNEPDDAGQIIIGGAMRNQTMPVDPAIARWFASNLEGKLKKSGADLYDTINENDLPLVGIAKEGERLCGAVVHTERRRKELGPLYQFMQIKVPVQLMKRYGNSLNRALMDIFADFQQQFPDEQSLQEYLEKNATEEDKIRLEGKMYFQDGLQDSKEIDEDKIAMSGSLRRALGLNSGDVVKVYDLNNPQIKFALEIVPAKTKKRNEEGKLVNRTKEEKVGWRIPAINTNGDKRMLVGKEIVIEKVE